MAYKLPTYDTSSKPRGYGIIIVNKFENYGFLRRESADKELTDLTNLVTSLGLILDPHQDLTKDQILSLLQTISERQELEEHSMFFIAICSHGGEDGIYGVDYGEQKSAYSKAYAIKVEEIRKRFNSTNCPRLTGKPKLLILNGCIEERVRSRSKSFIGLGPSEIQNNREFLTVYPTLSGYYKDFKHESVFIDVLCETLLKYHGHEITQLIQVINGTLMKSARFVKIDGNSVKLTETCVTENTLSKILCLSKFQ